MSKYKFTHADDTTAGGTAWVANEWQEAAGHPVLDPNTDVTNYSMVAFNEDLELQWGKTDTNGIAFYDASDGWFISTNFGASSITVIAYDAAGTKTLEKSSSLVTTATAQAGPHFLLADADAIYMWFKWTVISHVAYVMPQMLRYDKAAETFSLHAMHDMDPAILSLSNIEYVGQDDNYQIVVGLMAFNMRTIALVSKVTNEVEEFVPPRGYISGVPISDNQIIGTTLRGDHWVGPYDGDLISMGWRTIILKGTEHYPVLGKAVHDPPQEFYGQSGAAVYRMNYEGEIVWSIRHPVAVPVDWASSPTRGTQNAAINFDVVHAEIAYDSVAEKWYLWAWVSDGLYGPEYNYMRIWKIDLDTQALTVSKRVEYRRPLTKFARMGDHWYCADGLIEAIISLPGYTYTLRSIFAKVNDDAKVVKTVVGLSSSISSVVTDGTIVVAAGSSIQHSALREDLWV